MTLGDIISEYRKNTGMSMERFADTAGISKAYVSMLERNRTQRGDEPSPSIETYRSVACAIGLDVDELIRKVDGKVSIKNSVSSSPNVASQENTITFYPIGTVAAGYNKLLGDKKRKNAGENNSNEREQTGQNFCCHKITSCRDFIAKCEDVQSSLQTEISCLPGQKPGAHDDVQ